MLKEEVAPVWQDLIPSRFLEDSCGQLGKRLWDMDIALECRTTIRVHSDPKLLSRILENLLLNALETGGDGQLVHIDATSDDDQGRDVIKITDNGPRIAADLLPDVLFEPLKTTNLKERESASGRYTAL